MIHKLGAHLSISGGYNMALKRINTIGGNTLQIFSSSPRGWNFANVSDTEAIKFKEEKTKLGIDPIYFHASYLINLADQEKTGRLSKLALIAELNAAAKLGVRGSIIHLGSYKGDTSPQKQETLIQNIKEVLEKTPPETLFIIENAGNRKIGMSLEEIASIINKTANDRVRVCLDTCHLYSAGYDLSTEGKLSTFLQLFDKLIGLPRLELWHANDSRDPFSSFRDRHENIGEGSVGINTFKLLLSNKHTKNLAFIIETPGFDGKGPDQKNLEILKKLI